MNYFYYLIFLIISFQIKAQYPFEKYPAIKYKEYKNWKVYNKFEKEKKIHYTLTLPSFYSNKDTLTVQLTGLNLYSDVFAGDNSVIRIFRNKNQIQKFDEKGGLVGGELDKPEELFVEDINGDSLPDIKILIPHNACGAYNYYLAIIYLLQKSDGTFTMFAFTDLMMGFENRVERDIDSNGNYEIITNTFKSVNNHSYFLFNVYNFDGNNLINVNENFDYPIMTQILYRENYEVTTKISRQEMKKYSLALPEYYDKK